MDANIRDLQTLYRGPVSYRIPQFQRAYAWKQETQWEPLWADVLKISEKYLVNGVQSPILPHFMGAIVLQPQDNSTGEVQKRIVVDGQQRLTTLQLLIKALEKVFVGRNDSARAARLRPLFENEEHFLANDPTNQPKIRQSNFGDQRDFQRAIEDRVADSESAILQALDYFATSITKWINSDAEAYSDKADALYHAITQLIQIAVIDLDQEEQPHIIFETLNERGEQLTQSDRIKNTIMYRANVIDNANRARELWGMFEEGNWWRQNTGEARLNRAHNDRFLNYWVVMKSKSLGEVTSERVAAEFRNLLDSDEYRQIDIDKIVEEIKYTGVFYRAMEEDSIPEMKTFLKRIKALEVGTVTPLLMWLYGSRIPWKIRERCHAALESYLVRRMLCGYQSTGLNRFFEETIKHLGEVEPTSVDSELIKHLKRQDSNGRWWPTDNEIKETLVENRMRGNAARQRMILEAVEAYLRSEFAESVGDFQSLTIEHIMPQGWATSGNWPMPSSASGEDTDHTNRDNSVRELGNLTLVTQKLNSSVSNGPWNQKKETLRNHSVLFLNKQLLDDPPEIWDEKAIRDRSTKLVDHIIRIWPHADSI